MHEFSIFFSTLLNGAVKNRYRGTMKSNYGRKMTWSYLARQNGAARPPPVSGHSQPTADGLSITICRLLAFACHHRCG